MKRQAPHGAVDFAGQGYVGPGHTRVTAAQQAAAIAGRAVADGDVHGGQVVHCCRDAARILPVRGQLFIHPGLAQVAAAMQTAIGGGDDVGRLARCAHHSNAMNVAGLESRFKQRPAAASIPAAQDAADLHCRPDSVRVDRVEKDLGDTRRPHVDIGKLAQPIDLGRRPAQPPIGRAAQRRWPATG